MNNLKSKDLLGTRDLSINEINLIFETAKKFKEVLSRPIKKVPTLRHLTIANIFFENSTRTKLSFELAQKRLSADIINFSSSSSSINKGESLLDTINNILVMKVDMIVVRHPNPGAPHFISKNIKVPIINAGDGTNEHPTQALLDSFSIIEKLGSIKNKKISIIGDILHSRVAISNIHLLSKLGAKIMLCGPSTLIPRFIKNMGLTVTNDIKEALEWCDVANILRIQLERQNQVYFPSIREYSQYFGVNHKLLKELNKELIIMHPGPINRGVEINSDVVESKNSIILDQVENGVAIRMAIMYLLSFYKSTN
ncbi:MAG: aspartate carbamoyltransferase catalytic subunit [Flammeovirgaceae bacterium TMED290]|nr:MAG: aspartate carbamoyltransferase catalytic subunit [Flammeovirgaceae bacterium TMED290]|tara:strand:+ start:18454 stop:19386 length:933 start_codon:yes stop_codon:yes gene_type:complete